MGMGNGIKDRLAKRAAEEIEDGMIVNLGIGIPSLVPNFLPPAREVLFQAENGILGMGQSPPYLKEDENLCNAGGFPVTLNEGGSFFDSATAFGMIRRGYIDLTILGSLEVSEEGDLANWIVPGRRVPGVGGAMELAARAKNVVVLMTHVDKRGNSKLVKKCSLPLTAQRCVKKVITDLGVFSIDENGLLLTDLFDPHSIEEVIEKTDADFKVAKEIRMIRE
ncbi:3-oxoacid CoA-transferase subunit B [Falsibacillus albus]|uniref:3-oxoacid CoA-transferase subunit B n=1 Tax=Falsibacillus albus TaxID=2478915 RepID=A0A3L7JWS2_9BACI|nr:3-oxoacid CoA-transferase subunit B [Falsibacillus albus]RLQ95196.1 3-oxoacid CoA-transferase subunit B [Falsibacillus albus]